MGCDISVIGFRPPDEKWKKMKAVYDACQVAGIKTPKEVHDFFGWDTPSDDGVTVDIKSAAEYQRNDDSECIKVDIRKLPQDVNILIFSLSC